MKYPHRHFKFYGTEVKLRPYLTFPEESKVREALLKTNLFDYKGGEIKGLHAWYLHYKSTGKPVIPSQEVKLYKLLYPEETIQYDKK